MMNRRMFAAKLGALATALYAASQSIAKADDALTPNADPLTPAKSQADWDAQGWSREPVTFRVVAPRVITHSTSYHWDLGALRIEPNVRDIVRQKGVVV